MKLEQWKEITDIPGYMISSYGRVKSLEKTWISGFRNNGIKHKPETIMKPSYNKDGYLRVTLMKDNKTTYHSIHRLVAQEFIPNLLNKYTINHKNGIKYDNNVDNLEWMSIEDNNQHALDNNLNHNISITLYNDKVEKNFTSMKSASRYLDVDKGCISRRYYGKVKSSIRGYFVK